jgi:hypothetical protein
MARYSSIPITRYTEAQKQGYVTVKYPDIFPELSDIYVYTTRGDRYDTLALAYYSDPSLWWIIARANANSTTPDSLIPDVGTQIRIPGVSRISSILGEYETLNR